RLSLDGPWERGITAIGQSSDDATSRHGNRAGCERQLKTRVDSERHSISTCKLPNIEISAYDGKDFAQFKPFIDLFNAVIDSNQSLSNVQKLFYLRKYLTADALSVIINLPLVNESYPEAIKLLEKRFDNETRLISNHINVLLDLPQMQKGTAANIRSFISDARQQLYALKNLKQPVETWDMLLISILSRKLDSYTNRAYHLDRSSLDKLPTLEEFLSFLEKRAVALEDSSPLQNTCYEGKSAKLNNNHKVTNIVTKSNSKRNCPFCSNDHPIYSCPKFKMASSSQRVKFAADNKLCTTCLRNHTDKCKYSFKCQVCQNSHNTLLHEDEPKEAEKVISLHSNISTNQTNILLPTMKVKLIDKSGQEIEVKALLDCGSQVSIVKRSLVNKLDLTPVAQDSNIIGLGNTPNKVSECANILLQSNLYNVKFSVKCHVVETITTNLPQNYFDVRKCKLPRNVQLADDDYNKPSEIVLLLGVDFYSKVIIDGVLKLENGLVLQNTLFGHVVTGAMKNECLNLSNVNLVSNFVIQENMNDGLENIMKNFWLSEKMPEESNNQNLEFEQAEQCFKRCNKSMYANRISYWLDVKGPSYTLDVACASSMACIDHAYRSIQSGLCEAAIVGGCNLCMHPYISLNFKRAGFLCTDGKTKCFDKRGDGYVRSDAISVLFLQKAKDAKR
ncbi:Gag-pol polyprotein, partial [Operophtera brumata]